jgi:hypothetical protein
MASLYLTTSASGTLALASFLEHNLSGQGPTTATMTPNQILPTETPFADYLFLVANMHVHAAALKNNRAYIERPAYKNVFRYITTFPVDPPTLIMSTDGLGSDELKEHGFVESGGVNMPKGVMVNHKMSLESLRVIWGWGIDHDGVAFGGNVNPGGLMAWYYAWKAVGIFEAVVGTRVHASGDLFAILEVADSVGVAHQGLTSDGAEFMYERELLMDEKDGLVFNLTHSAIIPSVPRRAIASFSSYVFTSSEYVEAKGVVLPYFDGMLGVDRDFISTVFFRYFTRCICDNPTELAAIIPSLRRGFRNLSTSMEGRRLQHIFYGIQCAIETGAKLRILVDERIYRGLVLYDGDFAILENGELTGPYAADEVKLAMKALDVHKYNIARIVERLNGIDLKHGGQQAIDEEKARISSRYLANEILRRKVDTPTEEKNDDLKGWVTSLRYGDTFWPITPENVARLPALLMSGSLVEEEPYYHGTGAVFNPEPMIHVLAVFGPDAPTFSVSTGQRKFGIANPTATDPNLAMKGESRVLPYLPIYVRGLTSAAAAWRAVQDTKTLRTVASTPKGAGKIFNRRADVGHIGNPLFSPCYQSLREFAYSDITERRKRARESTDEEVIAKRKKAKETRDGLASLF